MLASQFKIPISRTETERPDFDQLRALPIRGPPTAERFSAISVLRRQYSATDRERPAKDATSEMGPFAADGGRRAHVRSYLNSRHRLAQYATARCGVLRRRYVKAIS